MKTATCLIMKNDTCINCCLVNWHPISLNRLLKAMKCCSYWSNVIVEWRWIMNSPKRKRKPNWTQDQLLLLAQLVLEKKNIIKGKFGTGISSKTKRETWERICLQINAAFPLVSRTTDDCERRWYALQSQSRVEIAAFKRANMATGRHIVLNK